MKICSHCKQEKPKTEFYKDNRKRDGLYSRCKKCQDKSYKNYRQRYFKTAYGKFIKIRSKAIERGKPFHLSFKFYLTLWGKPCFYCGKPLSVTSLDRVNNKIGYYKTNVVPCCRHCNLVKHDRSKEYLLKRLELARV